MIAAGVLRINIWFSIPVPKIKFDPPPQGKSALVFMKEETYGCDTHICHMDGYMVGYRVKEIDASDIGDELIYAIAKHLGIPVVVAIGYAAYNIGHTDDYSDIDMWTLWPHNKMFMIDVLKQLLSTKWSRCLSVKVTPSNLYPNVQNIKVFDITA